MLQYGGNEQEAEKSTKSRRKGHMPILAGIVIALIVIGLFALPMLMPSPMGGGRGPLRQGGGPSSSGGQFGLRWDKLQHRKFNLRNIILLTTKIKMKRL